MINRCGRGGSLIVTNSKRNANESNNEIHFWLDSEGG